MMTMTATVASLADAARALADGAGRRVVIGIAGAPGAGKSTLAEAVTAALGARAALVPMDGFHYANRVLAVLDRRARKGAPDTFDVDGFVGLLRRVRVEQPGVIAAPVYDRSIEEPIANAILIGPDIDIVIVEGNYLLLDEGGWHDVRALLDAAWFVEIEDDERIRRLIARHRTFGKSPDAAAAWSTGPDEANARLIAPTRAAADLVIGIS